MRSAADDVSGWHADDLQVRTTGACGQCAHHTGCSAWNLVTQARGRHLAALHKAEYGFLVVNRLEPFHCSRTILQKQTFLLKFSFIDISMPHIGVVYRVPFPCVLEKWYSSSKVHLTEKQSMRMYVVTKTCEVNLRLLSIHSV